MAAAVTTPQEGIHSLKPVVSKRIEASLFISSLGVSVRELVFNSIDAQCKQVHVKVGFTPLSVDVIDDGLGLSLDELVKLGHALSQHDGTSGITKNSKCYGFWGRSISSILALSERVIAISKMKTCPTGYQKVFSRGQSTGVTACNPVFPFGTHIRVEGLFDSLPVRKIKKQTNRRAEVESIKQFLQQLSVIQAHVIFIFETAEDSVVFRTSLSSSPDAAICGNVSRIMGVDLRQNDLFSISLNAEFLMIKGKAASTPIQSKAFQYIFINQCPVLQTHMHGLINKVVASRLAKCGIGQEAVCYPAFYLNMECDRSEYSLVSDSLNSEAEFKRQKCITEALVKVAEFIARHLQFCGSTMLSSEEDDKCQLEKMSNVTRVRQVEPKEVQVGRTVCRGNPHPELPCGRLSHADPFKPPWPATQISTLVQPKHFHTSVSSQCKLDPDLRSPSFEKTLVFNLQSGNCYVTPNRQSGLTHVKPTTYIANDDFSVRGSVTNKRDTLPRKMKRPATEEAINFKRIFKTWKNPTFQIQQETVKDCKAGNHSGGCSTIKFSKEMFQQIKVIGHIDNKFIAGILQWQSGEHDKKLLVLIDQHAADERVRLERFIHDVVPSCVQQRRTATVLSKPVHIDDVFVKLMGSHDTVGFVEYMAMRGFTIKQNINKITVLGLPSPLVTCCNKGTLPAISFVELKRIIMEFTKLWDSASEEAMPSSLLAELKSLACHGAIKFGDPLTLEQCRLLVMNLAKCNLPFQCAHGRPSLIPLFQLQ